MPLRQPPALGQTMLMPDTFEDRIVAITGGGTGLGRAMAVEFGRLGATVAILSRGDEHRERGVHQLRAMGVRAEGFAVDVRNPGLVAKAFDDVTATLGPVDVLVNNASGTFACPAEDLSLNGWRSVVEIVLDGTFFCSREFARRRMTAQRGGAILNIGSSYAWTGGPGSAHLASAKAGVISMTQSLAVEWAPSDIRVNTLVPGPFPHDDLPEGLKELYGSQKAATKVPAARVGMLQELGWAATYLCSPYANFVTGLTFVIDGGYSLRYQLSSPEFVPVREQLAAGPF